MKNKRFFVPWRNDFCFGERSFVLKLGHNYKHHHFYFDTKGKNPYFRLVNDNLTPKFFIDALIKKEFDDAMMYISRFSVFIDMESVKKMFDEIKTYNCIPVAYKEDCSLINDCEKVSSVLVSAKNKMMILHFYLINEPDSFGKWKIYRIEKENVKRNFERNNLWIKF